MRVMQYYLFKSLSLLPPLRPPPPAVCNKAKELTQTQTARICLIILCAIILSLLLTHSARSVRLATGKHYHYCNSGMSPALMCLSIPPALLTLSLTLSKFEFLLEGGNLAAQIAPNLTTGG